MSTETAPPVESEAHVTTYPGMGGTEPTGESRVDDAEPAPEKPSEEVAEGESPEVEAPEAESAPASNEPSMSKEEIATLQSRVRDADNIAAIVMASPERMKAFEAWSKQDRGEVAPDDALSASDKAIDDMFPRSDDREALRSVLAPFKSEIASLRKQLTQMQPALRQAHDAVVTGTFSRALVENGVSGDVWKDKGFLKFLGEQRRDPDFQRDERGRPAYAAKFLANAWKARSAYRNGNVAAREAVDRVKGGRLHGAAGTNGSGTTRVVEIDDSKSGYDLAALNARLKDPNVKIVYKSDKK